MEKGITEYLSLSLSHLLSKEKEIDLRNKISDQLQPPDP